MLFFYSNTIGQEDTITLFKDESFLIYFNKKNDTTYLNHDGICSSEQNLGRFVGRFAMPPHTVKMEKLDPNHSLISMTVRFFDMGIATDATVFYVFNFNSCSISKLCLFPDIGAYNLACDTILETFDYQFSIDKVNNKIILEEYYSEKAEYDVMEKIIKRREYLYNLNIKP
ncbi:MAG: hypothetical protein ACRBFS_12150 [Aureispira sp.]